jgi:signal transduction histidine kinase
MTEMDAPGGRKPLRLLLIEDQEADALLLLDELDRRGYDVVWERVQTHGEMASALEREWDVIITDYSLPQFDARAALELRRERRPDIPVIVVSGTISEEDAVESMRLGADDFISKGRFARLGPAIDRSRRDAQERQARRLAEARLGQFQKMEAIGQLAGGVAHDFNNLLGVIQGYGDLLAKHLSHDAAGGKRVEQILQATRRAAALTRQLLTFSRQQPLEAKPLDLNGVISGIDPLLRRLIREDIEIVTVLGEGLHLVMADSTHVEQVLMNLAINARDAIDEWGRITIETGNVELDETYVGAHPDANVGPHVMLAVSDTGRGMDAETLSHVFEPFYTTKERSKGTGLGLATVYGIVRQSGGHVAVYTESGRGTTFKVYLPRTDDAPAALPTPDTEGVTGRGSETIVIVEDEPALRTVIHDLLEDGGYVIVDGETPEASVAAAERHPGPIHLVLTDLVMPHMSGRDAAHRIQRVHGQAKVLFMSGYATAVAGLQGGLPLGQPFLQKPFTQDMLFRKVREVLNSRD